MQLAERLSKLGTETAFAVSAEAAAHSKKGNRVYPLHLGDMNINTPANIIEATAKAMRDGRTGYCPNYGIAELREALAADINKSHGMNYALDNVAIQPGGKPTIGKFFMAMMNPGDEVLYPNPGYPIYESQIEFQGGRDVGRRVDEDERDVHRQVAEELDREFRLHHLGRHFNGVFRATRRREQRGQDQRGDQ